jgi:hypothetical protein
MHASVFVITTDGSDAASLMRGRELPDGMGTVDWAAAGGRYSGCLWPKPGATSAKVFGDALPSFEAAVLGMIGESGTGVTAGRPGHQNLNGVDQLALRELHAAENMPGYLLTPDGIIHHAGLTPEENAAAVVEALGFTPPSELQPELEAVDAKSAVWEQLVARLLTTWAAKDAVLTVVDIHT